MVNLNVWCHIIEFQETKASEEGESVENKMPRQVDSGGNDSVSQRK